MRRRERATTTAAGVGGGEQRPRSTKAKDDGHEDGQGEQGREPVAEAEVEAAAKEEAAAAAQVAQQQQVNSRGNGRDIGCKRHAPSSGLNDGGRQVDDRTVRQATTDATTEEDRKEWMEQWSKTRDDEDTKTQVFAAGS